MFKILLATGIEKPCHKQFIVAIMLCILKDPKRELIKFLDAVVLFRLGAVKGAESQSWRTAEAEGTSGDV